MRTQVSLEILKTMTTPSAPSPLYTYPDEGTQKLWADGVQVNDECRTILGPMWYVPKDVRRYDKAVRDRANHTWTDGSLQEKAAQRTIENSLDFCHELRESDDEDSNEYPEFICANGGRSRTKTEENQGEARIIVNAIAKCPPVWDNLILERGNDNGCACPCARMLGEWMEAQGVDIKPHSHHHFPLCRMCALECSNLT